MTTRELRDKLASQEEPHAFLLNHIETTLTNKSEFTTNIGKQLVRTYSNQDQSVLAVTYSWSEKSPAGDAMRVWHINLFGADDQLGIISQKAKPDGTADIMIRNEAPNSSSRADWKKRHGFVQA